MKIGILGGTSPLVSIQLQRLIAESTPARKDEDHLEVVSYTNPKVPDCADGPESERDATEHHEALVTSAQLLVRAGVSMIAIPCNRAHMRIADIQGRVPVPVMNMVELAVRRVVEEHGKAHVGLIAAGPVVTGKIYERTLPDLGVHWILPDARGQEAVAKAVQAVRANVDVDSAAVVKVAKQLIENGAKVLLVGCTKLSMLTEDIEKLGKPVIDPMRVLAEHLVDQARVV
ncbi:MAG: amino acid racemase [Candidatus Liptonbacteria bacterium]|nr:amino acid racemase [Candidatus Liptonbacteria bacterium]